LNISWNWLKRHVDLSGLAPREIADRFTMSVAELEGIMEFGATYDRVLTARILAIAPHPQSDKMQIVELDLGDRRMTAVSGAPNTRVGAIIPLALPGTVLEGLESKPVVREVEIKGVLSPGVTCSEMELGISDEHTGLLEFPEDTRPGTPLTQLLPIHDHILEIDNKSITHRPDLWGHRGIAREIAALAGRKMLPLDLAVPEVAAQSLEVSVEAPDLCPRYMAQLFGNVKIEASPLWLKLALSVVGVRPISNVVDITNFVMLDTGNPTHAFDARFVEGNAIVVRRAEEGEILTTLDGEPRKLLVNDVVIADGRRGVALGGVMGGENSEIQQDTTNVILEAACFDPGGIRRTSSRLGLRTEASTRFEKGLDRSSPLQAAALFSRMLRDICPDAAVASKLYDVSAPVPEPTVVRIAPALIARKLGADIDSRAMKGMLEGLEFEVEEEGDEFVITVPTFRATGDISIPVDIVEEIGRLYGYDNIDPQPILAGVAPPPRVEAKTLERVARRAMVASGYHEVITYSFPSASQAASIGYSLDGAVELKNPISSDMPVLRRSLIPNLLQLAVKNGLRRDEFRLFEVGRVFYPAREGDEGGIPHQERRIAGLCYSKNRDNFDLYRMVKAHVESLFERLERGVVGFIPLAPERDAPWVVKERSRSLTLGTAECGMAGMLNPVVRDRMKIRGKVAFFEVNLEPHIAVPEQKTTFRPLPRFPAIQNDLSVIVGMDIQYERVLTTIRREGGELLHELELFAIFRGGPIPEGKKSLSFHLRFRSPERTLQDQEVAPLMVRILEALKREVGGEIREA